MAETLGRSAYGGWHLGRGWYFQPSPLGWRHGFWLTTSGGTQVGLRFRRWGPYRRGLHVWRAR